MTTDEAGDRVTALNAGGHDGQCVVYWIQSSPRARENAALGVAVREANARRQLLLALFIIDRTIPMANGRNFRFMLEALDDVMRSLATGGISLCVRVGRAVEQVARICREVDASVLVMDESHLEEGRSRREAVAGKVRALALQVDANVVVPVRRIPGEQYAAYAIRPKLMRLRDRYSGPQPAPELENRRPVKVAQDVDRIDVTKLVRSLHLPQVAPSPAYRGGETEALRTLDDFVDRKLDGYAGSRNHPEMDGTSNLSPYLRFGCISPALVLRTVADSGGPAEDVEAFVEEAFVRRELAENFTFYNPRYRSLDALPEWARRTLNDHRGERRPRIYSLEELEKARTGDDLWDASQREMLAAGKMAGYMRMYWGKRVIEWTRSPEEALRYLLYLNDRYELDGRSPNGYAGVQWCFGKHDRAFGERPIYGKVRYMSPSGVKKKVDSRAYVERVRRPQRPR